MFVHGLIGPFNDPRTLVHLEPAVVMSPDLPGYGEEADANPKGITVDAQMEFLRASVDRSAPDSRIHLVGHSVGVVVAASFAHRYPDRVASLVNVEGNFTLADAFWSASVAGKAPREVLALLDGYRADPERWLIQMGIAPSGDRVDAAAKALSHQPATTIQAMARAVVTYTSPPDYLRSLRGVFDRTTVHLVAGGRSRAAWDVPDWALAAAASYTEIPDCGHMIQLEAADAFGRVLADLVAGRKGPTEGSTNRSSWK